MSSAGDQPPSLGDFQHLIAETYGVQLAGVFLACVLYGVTCLQAFIYYMSHPKDPFLLKALPAYLVVLDTIHQFLYCTGMYKAVVNNFGNFNIFFVISTEVFIATMFQAWITSGAHLFFIYRIWRFAHKKWFIPAVTIPLSALQLVMIMMESIINLSVDAADAHIPNTQWMTLTALSANLVLDTFLMVAMIWLLKHENNSLFTRTNAMVRRLIVLTINTGMATTITTMITIVLLRTEPNNLSYLFFNVITPVLYCNSVLTNLNSRDYIRGRRHLMPSTIDIGSEDPQSNLELGPLRFPSKQPSSSLDPDAPDADSLLREKDARSKSAETSALGRGHT